MNVIPPRPPLPTTGLTGVWDDITGTNDARRHAIAAYRDTYGWALEEAALGLIDGFDQNHDGCISTVGVEGAMRGEAIVTRVSHSRTSLSGWGLPGAAIIQETTTRYSVEPLVRAADVDHDGVLTAAELSSFVASFDVDHDGRLSRAENDAAFAYGAVNVGSETRISGVKPPTTIPGAAARH